VKKRVKKFGLGGLLDKISPRKLDPFIGKDTPMTLRSVIDPQYHPIYGKLFREGQPLGIFNAADDVNKRVTPQEYKDPSRSSYVNPFTGETVYYRKGGKVKAKKCATGGKIDAAKNDKLAPAFLNQKSTAKAPKPAPKKFAKGGGIEIRGKTRGKFI